MTDLQGYLAKGLDRADSLDEGRKWLEEAGNVNHYPNLRAPPSHQSDPEVKIGAALAPVRHSTTHGGE